MNATCARLKNGRTSRMARGCAHSLRLPLPGSVKTGVGASIGWGVAIASDWGILSSAVFRSNFAAGSKLTAASETGSAEFVSPTSCALTASCLLSASSTLGKNWRTGIISAGKAGFAVSMSFLVHPGVTIDSSRSTSKRSCRHWRTQAAANNFSKEERSRVKRCSALASAAIGGETPPKGGLTAGAASLNPTLIAQ